MRLSRFLSIDPTGVLSQSEMIVKIQLRKSSCESNIGISISIIKELATLQIYPIQFLYAPY